LNGSFRWGDVGIISALIVNIIIGTWEIAHLDGRQEAFRDNLLRDEVTIQTLVKANAEKDVHISQLDDAVGNMKDNIQSILTIVQHVDTNTTGDANNPPNFPKHK